MGNGSLRRLSLLPLLKRGVTNKSRPHAPRGAQLWPNHPQRIPSANSCHRSSPRQSRGVLPRFPGRTSSRTRRGNVDDVSHDSSPQAVQAMPPGSSVSVPRSRTRHRQLQRYAAKIGEACGAFPASGLQLHPAPASSGSSFSRLHLQPQHFDRNNQDKKKLVKPSQRAAKPPRARGLVSGR